MIDNENVGNYQRYLDMYFSNGNEFFSSEVLCCKVLHIISFREGFLNDYTEKCNTG